MSSSIFVEVFEGVPQAQINKSDLIKGISIVELLFSRTGFLKSNGEALRSLKENSISVNKEKADKQRVLSDDDLIAGKYILLQRGKKNYFIIKVV